MKLPLKFGVYEVVWQILAFFQRYSHFLFFIFLLFMFIYVFSINRKTYKVKLLSYWITRGYVRELNRVNRLHARTIYVNRTTQITRFITIYVVGNVPQAHVPVPETAGNSETGTKQLGSATSHTIQHFPIWKCRTVQPAAFPSGFNENQAVSASFLLLCGPVQVPMKGAVPFGGKTLINH